MDVFTELFAAISSVSAHFFQMVKQTKTEMQQPQITQLIELIILLHGTTIFAGSESNILEYSLIKQEIIKIAAKEQAVLKVCFLTLCLQNEIKPKEIEQTTKVKDIINGDCILISRKSTIGESDSSRYREIEANVVTLTPIPNKSENETNIKACIIEPTLLDAWKYTTTVHTRCFESDEPNKFEIVGEYTVKDARK
ncbi:hypothetical protein PMKS-000286 [Pichia membranifaciens]|uniref:Uncharacterized protein n=1 Tax=Pichia membranifaciens TaxID=4926 RepID=A0A1Q2YBC2_9ASCO|nr:hypothetical protein PMKS-000286 [Pichia membranifaciens]